MAACPPVGERRWQLLRVEHETADLRLTDILVEGTWYAREHTNYNTVETLTALYQDDPALLPPLDVFQHEGRYLLADGFHRFFAARGAGVLALPCRISWDAA